MKIAPIDIVHKQFSKKMMGLEPSEVYAFLQAISEEMETLIRERNNLRETLREKELNIHEYRERDKALRETISTAQRMSEKIAEEAQRESKLILADANQQAEVIVKDARDSLKRIYQEVSELKKLKIQFDAHMRSMLQAHLSIMDQQDAYLPASAQPVKNNVSTAVSPIKSQAGVDII
jgi:cell division initiation protein